MMTSSGFRPSESKFIESVWHYYSDKPATFTSTAAVFSEIVIGRVAGRIQVAVRGPETRASAASSPSDGEFVGIVFRLGTFMPMLSPKGLRDRQDVYLPPADTNSFWLDNDRWELPTYENADVFVARLIRAGLLVHDPQVDEAVQGGRPAISRRALQYRFIRATGLSHKAIQQIERAQRAFELLQAGRPIAETAVDVGYYDQSHLTNALKRYLGRTPAEIKRDGIR